METGGEISAYAYEQNVWGLRYIDDLMFRDGDGDDDPQTGNLGFNGSGLDLRQYFLQDANWNVVAWYSTAGSAIYRFSYSAYGSFTPLSSVFVPVESLSGHEFAFTGRQYDEETGLYHYRNRFYGAELGRFLSRDPIEYEGGDFSLYRYVLNSPLTSSDPLGEATVMMPSFPIKGWSPELCKIGDGLKCRESTWGKGFDMKAIRDLEGKLRAGSTIVVKVIYLDDCGGGFSLTCPATKQTGTSKNPSEKHQILVCISKKNSNTCQAMKWLEHEFVHVQQYNDNWNRTDRDADETAAYRKSCEIEAQQDCRCDDDKTLDACAEREKKNSLGGNQATIDRACANLKRKYLEGGWQ